MKKVMLGVLFLLLLAPLGANCKDLSIPVKIKYMDGEKIVPNAVVYLLYQAPDKLDLLEKTANTGTGNVVSFNVPLDKDGASFPFVVLYTKEDAKEARDLAKTTAIRAFRTPSGEKCEFLELTVTKAGSMGNKGCAVQMWSMGKK